MPDRLWHGPLLYVFSPVYRLVGLVAKTSASKMIVCWLLNVSATC